MSRTISKMGKMRLRSACHGDCDQSLKQNSNNHNHHKHCHHKLQLFETKDILEKESRIVNHSHANLSVKSQNLSVETVSGWGYYHRSSTVGSTSLPSPVAPSAKISNDIIESSASNNHLNSEHSTLLYNKSREKTDYTYARSSSYRSLRSSPDAVPFPNMSRRGLSSPYEQHGDYSDYLMYNHVGNVVSDDSFAANFHQHDNNLSERHSKYGSKSTYRSTNNNLHRNLPFGSDCESSEEDFELDYESTYAKRQSNKGSFLRLWFNIFDCVVPITTIWEKICSVIYWIVRSFLLLDSRILTRKVSKKWIFLPLLLLLLLLLLALFSDRSERIIESATYAAVATKDAIFNGIYLVFSHTAHYVEVAYLSTIPFFAYFRSNKTNETESGKYFSPQKAQVIGLSVRMESQLSQERVEEIVRSIVGEEMMHFTSKLKLQPANASPTDHSASFDAHRQHLSSLHAQIQGILEQQEVLARELKETKNNLIRGESKPTIDTERMRNLESEMKKMKDRMVLLQENQAALELSMRDCCKNNTYDPAIVENQVTSILLQMMDENADSGKMEGFQRWLKTTVASDVEKLSRDKSREAAERAEAAARSAAAAAVRDALKQRENGLGAVVLDGKLSEIEVRKIVRDALAIYDADKTGLTDYALESAGGSILSTRCSETYQIGSAQVSYFGIPFWTQTNSPRIVIQPGVRPGECWAFKGSEGYLVIQLMGWVQPTAFSLEHIPRSLAPNGNIDSAPKEFSVYGLYKEKNLDATFIGKYSYDADGEPLQIFAVAQPDIDSFPIMELRIHSNHGNLDFTCLYRFRVHGKLSSKS